MGIDRRRFLAFSALGLTATEAVASPSPTPSPSLWARGVSAIDLKIEPNSSQDQTGALQRAIEQTAAAGVPLILPPGIYRAGNLSLPTGARLMGCPGASRLAFTEGASLVSIREADHVMLSGLVLDGGMRPLGGRALVHVLDVSDLRIEQCEIVASAADGIALDRVDGDVSHNRVEGVERAAIFSIDARGLTISRNSIRAAGNNGIQVWRSRAGEDGTLVLDNRIEDVLARDGGSGQNGNAINVFRAGNVIVRGNRIRNAAFSAVRGNAASNLQMIGNNCRDCKEVALYAEFEFEGAMIANNVVDGAAIGVSVTNFNRGGRLAIVQGNLIRNLLSMRPAGTDPEDGAGIGISVEADTAVTNNVIENAPFAGDFSRLRTISSRPHGDGQHRTRRRDRDCRVCRPWRRRCRHCRQSHREHEIRCDRRDGPRQTRDRRSCAKRRYAVRPTDDRHQSSAVNEDFGRAQRADLDAIPVPQYRMEHRRKHRFVGAIKRQQACDQSGHDNLRRPCRAVITFDGDAEAKLRKGAA